MRRSVLALVGILAMVLMTCAQASAHGRAGNIRVSVGGVGGVGGGVVGANNRFAFNNRFGFNNFAFNNRFGGYGGNAAFISNFVGHTAYCQQPVIAPSFVASYQPSYIQPSYIQPSYIQPSYIQPSYQPAVADCQPAIAPSYQPAVADYQPALAPALTGPPAVPYAAGGVGTYGSYATGGPNIFVVQNRFGFRHHHHHVVGTHAVGGIGTRIGGVGTRAVGGSVIRTRTVVRGR